jgi:metallo-beta-lactamase family protein
MKITFLGATQTVTGSRFLVEEDGVRALVDCGLFQGPREWKERNWENPKIDPASIDCIILSHAHIDHSGFLPRYVKLGFKGPIYCTAATAELLELMLPDSGHLQEEDAEFANKLGKSRHGIALPLYTEEDAWQACKLTKQVDFYAPFQLSQNLSFQFLRAGHILGSGMVQLNSKASGLQVLFSGDLGRPIQYITKKPDAVESADYLILESTYGNRLHQKVDVKTKLAEIIKDTAARGGVLLVPAFAIGRTQELLFILRILEEARQVPKLPVWIDSPMAIKALPIYHRHDIDFSAELQKLADHDPTPFICHHIHSAASVEESKKLNDIHYPAIIISASGMATGGRILHHMKHRIEDHRNTILFIGFQAQGTKGRFLVEGAEEIRIHKQNFRVNARIEYMDGLSAHADYEEMLQWLSTFKKPPRTTFLVHGEESASQEMAQHIRNRYGWNVVVPAYHDSVLLD